MPADSVAGRFLRVAWAVARKDIMVERRNREILFTTLFFAVTCVLVLAFGLVRDGQAIVGTAPAVLWVAIAFSGTLALGRTFERERATATLSVLLLAPVERAAVYVGKLVGLMAVLALVEAVLVPLTGLFFSARLFGNPVYLVGLLALGTLGFAAVGTLFAAMLGRAGSRDVMLPILLYPITVPALIAGVRGTGALLEPEPLLAIARAWIGMLVFFDVVFVTLALWTFDHVMTD
ncbi:MAG: heme exporter protein CcmB [Vicinamibacterales bacterium]